MNHARDVPHAGEGRAISRGECVPHTGDVEKTPVA